MAIRIIKKPAPGDKYHVTCRCCDTTWEYTYVNVQKLLMGGFFVRCPECDLMIGHESSSTRVEPSKP